MLVKCPFKLLSTLLFACGCNIIPVIASDHVKQNFVMYIPKELGLTCCRPACTSGGVIMLLTYEGYTPVVKLDGLLSQ